VPEGSPLESGTPVTNSSTSGFGRLDVGPGDVLWVGGLPPLPTPGPPPLLKTKNTGLAGCLHRVVLDGHTIGLWNFASQTAAGCAACIQRSALVNDFGAFNDCLYICIILHELGTCLNIKTLLLEILGSHGDGNLDYALTDYEIMWSCRYSMFWRNVLPISYG
jgi:hypothetical protein